MLPSNGNYHISLMLLSPFFIKGTGMQNIPLEALVGQSHTCLCRPAPSLTVAWGGDITVTYLTCSCIQYQTQ